MLNKYIIFLIVIEIAVIIKGDLCLPNLCVPSCPPRPICPPTFCLPPPVCPPPPTCAPCYQAVPIINDCCCSCNICRVLPRANLYGPKITTQEINDNPHCNSEDLKEIMENVKY
uniref:Uncharacterized protein n=1 Tax=Acrobeloides nanus TaxID=290746 RepID=A0A914CYU1_9BILA